MKKIMLIGSVACGKTTLCQRLNGIEQSYKKTQALEVINQTIDTPGEYLEHRSFLSSLMVTSVETDLVLFLQDATQDRYMYSAGLSSSFPVPAIGVVTKIDIATESQRQNARDLLALAGADPIFEISATNGIGMDLLLEYLQSES